MTDTARTGIVRMDALEAVTIESESGRSWLVASAESNGATIALEFETRSKAHLLAAARVMEDLQCFILDPAQDLEPLRFEVTGTWWTKRLPRGRSIRTLVVREISYLGRAEGKSLGATRAHATVPA